MKINPYLIARLAAVQEAFRQVALYLPITPIVPQIANNYILTKEEQGDSGGGGGGTARGLRGKHAEFAKTMRRLGKR